MTAATWFSTKWAHYAHPTETLIRVTSGRYHDTRTLEMDDDTLVERLLGELTEMVPLSADPIDVRVHRWLDTFPQYTVGHLDRMETVRSELAGLASPAAIAGMGVGGIGIPACVGQAHSATKTLVDQAR
jgi:oxygen-dependent protoporphyrinogen oxidase